MHPSAFQYLAPTNGQMLTMSEARDAAAEYAAKLERLVPDGADKVDILRQLRTVAMWVNVAITRQVDGSPRTD
jgi:hypothetical protein